MKNSIKNAFSKFGLMLFLVMFSITGKGQTVAGGQYSLSIGVATATQNTIDVPLIVSVVNPSAGMRFTGFQTSVNFNTAIINGGTITGSFIPSSAVTFATIGNVNSGTAGNVRMSITSLSTGASGVDLAQGATLNIGTIRIINSVNWATGNANMWLQNVLATGRSNSAVSGVAFGTSGAAVSYTTTQPTSPPGLILSHTSSSTYSLTVGQICASVATEVVTNPLCLGGTGSVSIKLSPTPTNSTVSYTGAGSGTATLSSGSFTINGLAAGNYTVNVANTGCTTIPVSFTITEPAQATSSITRSACDSYTWGSSDEGNGQTYTQSGTYSYTDTSGDCPVIRSLELTIIPSSINTTNINACDSYTWNGTTYTESGLYTGPTANCVTEQLNLTLGLSIAAQPTNPTICKAIGATASVSVVATGGSATYQWQVQAPTGTTWAPLANNANYTGVTSPTLTIVRTTTAVPATGTKFRVVVANSCVPGGLISAEVALQELSVLSKAASITARSATNVSLAPALTTCIDSSVNLTLAAGSIGNIQWQSSTDGITFTNFGDLVSQSALSAPNLALTIPSGNLTQDTWFRVVASNGVCNSVNGTAIKITVSTLPVAGTIAGGEVTVCAPLVAPSTSVFDLNGDVLASSIINSTTLSLTGNTPGATIVWQRSTNFVNSTSAVPVWSTVANLVAATPTGTSYTGAGTSSLVVSNLATTTWFRARLINGACAVDTEVTKITVSPSAKAGAVASPTSVCIGGSITFTSAAYTGNSIAWQVSTTTNASSEFQTVAGETGLTFTINTLPVGVGQRFFVRSVVTSGDCTLSRGAVRTVTVNPLSVAGTATGGGTVCSGGTTTLRVAGNVGKVQWEFSTDGVNYASAPFLSTLLGYQNPNNADTFATTSTSSTATSYVVTNITAGTFFRARVTSGACSSVYTNELQMVIGTEAVAGTATAVSTTLCAGTGTSLALTGNVGAIQWQRAPISATTGIGVYTNISGQTGNTVNTGNLTASTSFRAIVSIGSCIAPATTTPITITVNPLAKGGTVAIPTTNPGSNICSGSSKTLTVSGSVGTIQWQMSTTSATEGFSNVPGAITTPFTFTNITQDTWFRVVTTSGVCPNTATSNVIGITVTTTPAVAGTISGTNAVCTGTGTVLTLADNFGTVQWQRASVVGGVTGTFAAISLATGTAYTTPVLTATTAFRVLVTNGSCIATTSEYRVVVSPVAKFAAVTGNTLVRTLATAICTTATAPLSLATGSVGTIQWQSYNAGTSATTVSNTTLVTWTDIEGATSPVYNAASSTAGNVWFRIKFTSGPCSLNAFSVPVNVWFKDCGGIAKIETEAPIARSPFAAVAYPNPFSDSFNLGLTTSSEDTVGIMVYDMTGKLIERRDVQPSDIVNHKVGDRCPSGVYNVVITQGQEVKVLRVVKR